MNSIAIPVAAPNANCAPLADSRAAPMLAALGSEPRLRVYRLLLKAGREGMSVTALQRATGIPPSTLGHHISMLVEQGLVAQTRLGRELLCSAQYEQITQLSAFLLQECCAGPSANLR